MCAVHAIIVRELISARHGSLFITSRISHGAYPQASWGIQGTVTRFTDASVNDARRLHDRCVNKIIGDGRATSVTAVGPTSSMNAIRRVHDGPTTDPQLNSHRAVVEQN